MSLANVLVGTGVEIFASDLGLMACRDRQIVEVDELTLKKLKDFTKPKMHIYREIAGGKQSEQLAQCARCMFSNLDGTPDIDENGDLSPEVVECDKRGKCKFEGIGCLPLPKNKLSPAQQRVAELCTLPSKIIAEKLYISHFTVKRHLQDVKRITGARNIAELVKILN
ncbi:helix-turn-helix transcriptional regulator [Pedobacter sp.]